MPQVRCPECFHAVSQSRDNSNFLFCFLFHSWAGVLNDAKKHAGLFLLSPSLKLWVRLFFNSFPVNYEDTDFPNSVLSAFSFNIIHENPAVSFHHNCYPGLSWMLTPMKHFRILSFIRWPEIKRAALLLNPNKVWMSVSVDEEHHGLWQFFFSQLSTEGSNLNPSLYYLTMVSILNCLQHICSILMNK